MLATTSFNPIQWINSLSLMQSLGLVVSNKQQIIAKAAIVGFAILSVNDALLSECKKQEEQVRACEGRCYQYAIFPFNRISMFKDVCNLAVASINKYTFCDLQHNAIFAKGVNIMDILLNLLRV